MVFRCEAGPLKIATFNINNINKRLHNLTAWLARAQPDVVCLQELKVEQRAFPASALRDLGYRGVWLGERSWNGVAILARECHPVLTRSSLPGNPQDRQARYIEAAVNGVLIASIYLPNGNPQPGPKFDYKLAWFERLIEHGAELMKAGVPVVLAGDYNAAGKEPGRLGRRAQAGRESGVQDCRPRRLRSQRVRDGIYTVLSGQFDCSLPQ